MSTLYCQPEEVQERLGIDDSQDQAVVTAVCEAASRQIDGWCGRRFYQDTTVVVREFYAQTPYLCDLLDQPDEGPATEISTTTGLIVKTDTALDGTFATTLTISTDFILLPRNAAADSRGFSEIVLADNYTFPKPANMRAGVQVTAKFGWPSIPADVTEACIVQAAQLFSNKDAVFGAVALGDSSAMYLRSTLNVQAKALLAPYQKAVVG